MSKNKNTEQATTEAPAEAKQPEYIEELLKDGSVTLEASTREELAKMVKTIPADVRFYSGAAGRNFDRSIYTLQINLVKN